MMIRKLPLLILLMASLFCAAQTPQKLDPPMSLDEIVDYVSEPALPDAVEKVIAAVQLNGLDFGLDPATLTRILDAAAKGKRTPDSTSRLVLQILQACPDCRGRYFGPMNRDQILALLNKKLPAHIALQEIQLRRADPAVPKTPQFADELRRAGASPEFVDIVVPSDEMEISAPAGYTKIPLVRADAYDRKSKLGRLVINAEISGSVEFMFRYNSLFWRPAPADEKDKKAAAPMGDVRNLTGSFSAPVPAVGEEFVEYDYESLDRVVDRQKSRLIAGLFAKGARVSKIALEGKAPDPYQFRFTVTEADKQPRPYEIRLRWNVRDTPKPALKN